MRNAHLCNYKQITFFTQCLKAKFLNGPYILFCSQHIMPHSTLLLVSWPFGGRKEGILCSAGKHYHIIQQFAQIRTIVQCRNHMLFCSPFISGVTVTWMYRDRTGLRPAIHITTHWKGCVSIAADPKIKSYSGQDRRSNRSAFSVL